MGQVLSMSRSTPTRSSSASRSADLGDRPDQPVGGQLLDVGLRIGRVLAADLRDGVGPLEEVHRIGADHAAGHQRDHRPRPTGAPRPPRSSGRRRRTPRASIITRLYSSAQRAASAQAPRPRPAADDQVGRRDRLGQGVQALDPVVLALRSRAFPPPTRRRMISICSSSIRKRSPVPGTGTRRRRARPRASPRPSPARSARPRRCGRWWRRSSPAPMGAGRSPARPGPQAQGGGARRQAGDVVKASSEPRSALAHHREVVVGAEKRVDRALLAGPRQGRPSPPRRRTPAPRSSGRRASVGQDLGVDITWVFRLGGSGRRRSRSCRSCRTARASSPASGRCSPSP